MPLCLGVLVAMLWCRCVMSVAMPPLAQQQRAEQFYEELLTDRGALEVDVASAAEQLRDVTRQSARILQSRADIMELVQAKTEQSEATAEFSARLRDLKVCGVRCKAVMRAWRGRITWRVESHVHCFALRFASLRQPTACVRVHFDRR